METLSGQQRQRLRLRAQRHAHLRDWWRDAQWWVIGGLTLVVIVLGFVGFGRYQQSAGNPANIPYLSYKVLQLFVLESGSPTDGGPTPGAPIPVTLEIARFLAPVVGAAALLGLLAALFRDQFQRARLRLARGHVVICGAGRKGAALARSLREHGYRVVVIERDAGNDNAPSCAAMGIPVVAGDATESSTLRRAGVARAAQVIAVCGESGANAEVAASVHDLATGRAQPLDCLAHIDEPRLCDLLRTRYLATRAGPVRLDFFNVFERGAQVLLVRHPFFQPNAGSGFRTPHLLVVGLGRLGQALILQAARNWIAFAPNPSHKFLVTAVDRDATRVTGLLSAAHPEIGAVCDLMPAEIDVNSPDFETGAFLSEGRGGMRQPTVAYVCFDDDARALRSGMGLHRWLRQVPIIIRSQSQAGVPTLLRTGEAGLDNLHGFALMEHTCDADLLLGGTYELLARALHADYVQRRQAQGWSYGPAFDQSQRTDPALARWRDLPEDLRESNRSQAAHTGTKLAAVGCSLEEIVGWGAPLFTFTEAEVEQLAEMEHERWVGERTAMGWKPGPRDLARRCSPYLVPYGQLPERVKESNRAFVRDLPKILAKVGQQIVRQAGTAPGARRPAGPAHHGRHAHPGTAAFPLGRRS